MQFNWPLFEDIVIMVTPRYIVIEQQRSRSDRNDLKDRRTIRSVVMPEFFWILCRLILAMRCNLDLIHWSTTLLETILYSCAECATKNLNSKRDSYEIRMCTCISDPFFFFLLYIILHTDVFYDTFKRQLCNYKWVLVFSVYLPLMNIIFHTHYIKRKKTLEIGFHRINNVQVTSSYLKFIPVEKLQSE